MGAGAFGSVYRSLDLTTGAILAVKSSSAAAQSQQMLSLEREIFTLRHVVPSRHIVQYLGDDWTCEGGVPTRNLLIEFAPGGSIASLLKTFAPDGLPEGLVRRYTHGILLGLRHIHGHGVAHLDIKGGNVLVAESGDVRICDFGAARFVGRDEASSQAACQGGARAAELRGTLCWMAPEVTRGQWGDTRSDIWSLGCTVLEMMTGRPPWAREGQDTDWRAVMARIGCTQELPPFPLGMSESGKDFVSKCLVRDPCGRWTAEELLRHPFLNEPRHPNPHRQHLASQGCALSTSPVSVLSPIRSSDPSAADDVSLNSHWAQPPVRDALVQLQPASVCTTSLETSAAAPYGASDAATHILAPAAAGVQLVVAMPGDDRMLAGLLDSREGASGAAPSGEADCDEDLEGTRFSALDSPLFAMCSGPPSPLLLSPLSDVAAAIGGSDVPERSGQGRESSMDWHQDSLMLWPVSPQPQHCCGDEDSVSSIPIATPVDPTHRKQLSRLTCHTGATFDLWESEFWPSRSHLGYSGKLQRSWL